MNCFHRSTKYTQKSESLSNHSRRRISFLRFLLLLCIVGAGVSVSCFSYYYIRKYQYQLYEREFSDMVLDNYRSVNQSIFVKSQLNVQVAINFGITCPYSSNWPNCSISSDLFNHQTQSLSIISQIGQFSLLPIITPENRAGFEAYATNFLENDKGYSKNFKHLGIYNFHSNGTPYHTPLHSNSTKYDIAVPAFQITGSTDAPRPLLFNLYSMSAISGYFNSIIDCVNHTKYEDNPNIKNLADYTQTKCTALTDITRTLSVRGSLIISPIFPFNEANQTQPVGFSATLFFWQSLLASTVRFDSSFECMIQSSTGNRLYFKVNHGEVKEIAETQVNTPEHPDGNDGTDFNHNIKKTFILNNNQGFPVQTQFSITYYSTISPPTHQIAILSFALCLGITLLISLIFMVFLLIMQREVDETDGMLKSKRIFVRFISHEIRTPLNTILLGLKLLNQHLNTMRNPLTPFQDFDTYQRLFNECSELIKELDANSNIAVSTLNDIINYDKIETKTFTIEKQNVNLWSVVHKNVGLLSLQAKEKDVDLKLKSQQLNSNGFSPCKIDISKLRIKGDYIKLGQVVRNLISNALKFTPSGGEVLVSVFFEPRNAPTRSPRRSIISVSGVHSHSFIYPDDPLLDTIGSIIIRVLDTGPGLSLEQQQCLFREGVQFNPNELQAGQGSGLGLWISKEIVNLHSGKIVVKSDGLGKGAMFEVKFPVFLSDEIEEVPSTSFKSSLEDGILPENLPPTLPLQNNITLSQLGSSSSNVKIKSSRRGENQNILIVDDARSNRKLVSRILSSEGFICHEAENGEECVKIVLSGKINFKFILLDYEMPILDGPSAARQLRDAKCDILIIGITGNVLPEDQDYFIKQGANAVLPKPLNVDKLFHKMNEIEGLLIS